MKTFFHLLVLCAACLAQPITLQDAYNRCRDKERTEIEPCVMQLINDLRPLVLEGIPELNLTTEDVGVEDLYLSETSGDNYITANFFNGKVKGFHDMHMQRLKIDYENGVADWAILYPEYLFSGRYFLDASILFFPLQGSGTCWFKCTDLVLKGISKFEIKEIDGQPHLQELETDFTFDYKEISARLNNLFDGDPLLAQAGIIFVNQNVDVMIDELRPSVRRSFAEIGGNNINRILAKMNIEDIAGYQYIKK